MTATQGETLAVRLGFKAGQVVQEVGKDEDCDEALRESIESVTGSKLVDEEYEDIVDMVLLWWRENDGDLLDKITDVLTPLDDGGFVVLLTPKAGREGYVEPSDIAEAAEQAGLTLSTSVNAALEWSGTRLGTPTARR